MHRTQWFATVGLILIGVAGGLAACQPEDAEDLSVAPPAGGSATTMATEQMPTEQMPTSAPEQPAPAGETTATPSSAAGSAEEPDLVIEAVAAGGTVSTGGGRHELALGDVVLIRITSDVADEVHVHGYDYSIPVSPGVPTEMKFRADIAGVFEVELEESKLKLFDLLVR